MRLNSWLTRFCQQLCGPVRRSRIRRFQPQMRAAAKIEWLEPRQLLTSGPVAVGTETKINSYTTSNQSGPSVGIDSAGDYVVVWSGAGQNGNGIYAQRFNSAGAAQGSNFNVATATNEDISSSQVAMNSSGGFVVTWVVGLPNLAHTVYAQRYNAAGTAQGTAIKVNSSSITSDALSSVAIDTAGDFVVTWYAEGADGNGYGILAQRYNSAGTAQGVNFKVNTHTTGSQVEPAVAMDSAGDFAIVWKSDGQDGSNYGIYAQRYNAAGTAQGSEFRVNALTTGVQEAPSIAMNATGSFVISWDDVYQEGVTNSPGIYAQRFNAAGATQGIEIHVNSYVTGAQQFASIAEDSAGDFIVAWESAGQDGSGYGIYAQQFSATGVQGTEFRVNTHTAGVQEFAVIAMDATGKLVTAWESAGQDGSGYGIYAQRFQAGVNHAPIGTSKTVTTLEDTKLVLKTTDFGFTDPNDTPANSLLGVKFTTLPTAGVLTDNGIALTVNQIVSAADISSGKLVFDPEMLLSGNSLFACKFQVEDNGGTGNGGVNLDPTAKVMSITITHVNQQPSGTSKTVTTLENVAYALKVSDFGFTDPYDVPANALLAVKFTTLPTTGLLTDNGLAVTANQFVSVADINSGKLVFKPTMLLSGGPFFLCKFQVEDNGGTANGGVNLDPTAKVMYVKITHVNQAPAGTAHTATMLKNTSYTFKSPDFGFTDPNDSPPNTLLSVKITTLPLLGSLKDNGVAVAAGAHISLADITTGKLKYTPATNGTGANYASFTFQVQDNGGTANSGVDTDSTVRKMTLSVS